MSLKEFPNGFIYIWHFQFRLGNYITKVITKLITNIEIPKTPKNVKNFNF